MWWVKRRRSQFTKKHSIWQILTKYFKENIFFIWNNAVKTKKSRLPKRRWITKQKTPPFPSNKSRNWRSTFRKSIKQFLILLRNSCEICSFGLVLRFSLFWIFLYAYQKMIYFLKPVFAVWAGGAQKVTDRSANFSVFFTPSLTRLWYINISDFCMQLTINLIIHPLRIYI